MYVVPDPSDRWTTTMSVFGSVTPAFGFRDRRVVPLRDLAEEDVGQDRARELQLRQSPGML